MRARYTGIIAAFAVVALLVTGACRNGGREYALRNIHLGMSLDQFRVQFPSVDLTKIQLRNGSTVMLGSLPIDGFVGPSVVLGDKNGMQVVVQVSAEGGPTWGDLRKGLETLNGPPDHTWKSNGNEAAVWGADTTPHFDGTITPNISELCSHRCLVATKFGGWTSVQLYDGEFFSTAGPIP